MKTNKNELKMIKPYLLYYIESDCLFQVISANKNCSIIRPVQILFRSARILTYGRIGIIIRKTIYDDPLIAVLYREVSTKRKAGEALDFS